MKARTRLVLAAFGALLRLYPPAFRETFADEMGQVLSRVLSDAESSGHWWRTGARELGGAAGCLVVEHLHLCRKEILMNTSSSTWWGAVGLGLAVVISRLPVDARWQSSLALYLLAGAFAGWSLSQINPRGAHRLIRVMAGVAAFMAGYLVHALRDLSLASSVEVTPILTLALLLGEPLTIAITAAALIGLLDRDGAQIGRLVLNGAVGAVGGSLIGLLVAFAAWGGIQAVDSYRPGFDGALSSWVQVGGHVLIGIIFPGVAGLMAGARLGRTEGRWRQMHAA
ncbi:MAG: hypothetical protein JNL73_16865 [Anaerolineales bacterium]|nr:hypothetical protein [Anaerolineales bacterium]